MKLVTRDNGKKPSIPLFAALCSDYCLQRAASANIRENICPADIPSEACCMVYQYSSALSSADKCSRYQDTNTIQLKHPVTLSVTR